MLPSCADNGGGQQYNIRVDNLGNSTGPNNLFTVSDMLAGAGTSFADVATLVRYCATRLRSPREGLMCELLPRPSQGTVISMNIDWTCAFDWWSRPCVPKFTYTRYGTRARADRERERVCVCVCVCVCVRESVWQLTLLVTSLLLSLDDPNQSFSNGFNFRYANYYSYPNENGTVVQYRDLIKAYGIRFSFLITGVGRKFSIVPLLVLAII